MIHLLDSVIKAFLISELSLKEEALSFSAPDGEFPPTDVELSAINLFLYDVRENWELRNSEWRDERVNGRFQRQPPPVRVDCSYLITAWTAEAGEKGTAVEHELLGDVMRVLLRHRRIPAAYLPAAWRDEPPLRAKVLPQENLQSLGEFWQAMGGKPKAALHYTVTISVPLSDEPEKLAAPPREHLIDVKSVPLPAQHVLLTVPAAEKEE